MTNYSRGADFERKVKKDLILHGWDACRVAGSRGLYDVMAHEPGGTSIRIQCKNNAVISKADRESLITHCLAFNCVPILAYNDRGVKYLELFNGQPMPWWPIDGGRGLVGGGWGS